MTPDLSLTQTSAAPRWTALPAWASLLLVPMVGLLAIEGVPRPTWAEAGIALLCVAIMAAQLVVARQLGQARRRLDELVRTAQTDELTGLGNRRAMAQAMQRELRRARRQDTPASVLVVDLDGFKAVNDRLGHARGDELLRAFADLLVRYTRADFDGVFRYGGDEFVVLLPDATAAGAERAADRIRRAFGPVASRRAPGVSVACSIGVAELAELADDATVESWLAAADARMYAEKSGDSMVFEGTEHR